MDGIAIGGLVVAVVVSGCIAEDDPSLSALNQNACVLSFGGHEICDKVDNDCDGVRDEACGPIDSATITPYACVPIGALGPGAGGTVFIDHAASNEVGRIEADGSYHANVVWTAPLLTGRQIVRAPQGDTYLVGNSGSQVGAYEISPATGAVLGVALFGWLPHAWGPPYAMDADGGLFVFEWGGPTPGLKRWDGSQFVMWGPDLQATHMAVSDDGDEAILAFGIKSSPNWFGQSRYGGPVTVLGRLKHGDWYVEPRGLARDAAGRIYIGANCHSNTGGVCHDLFRYDADGQNRVTILSSDVLRMGSITFLPESNQIVMQAHLHDPACGGQPTWRELRRIPL